MKQLNLLLLILILLCISCKKDTGTNNDINTIEDFLVKNNDISGWTFSGSGWVANNISELTIYINGAADIYQRHGFVEAAHQDYSGLINNNDATLGVTVNRLESRQYALELFNEPDLGMTGAFVWQDGAGEAAHYARYSGLSQILAFYNGSYFVMLTINRDTEESLNVIKQFALNVDAKF